LLPGVAFAIYMGDRAIIRDEMTEEITRLRARVAEFEGDGGAS
jgi:hypothetical protein